MKISDLDRVEALIRIPEYLNDLAALDRLREKSSLRVILRKTRELEEKYQLLWLIRPEQIEAIKNPVITGISVEAKVNGNPVSLLHPVVFSPKEIPEKIIEKRKQLLLKQLVKTPSHYMTVKIDLNKSREENLFLISHDYDALKDALDQFKTAKKERERDPYKNCNPWEIYDKVERDKITQYAIAKEKITGTGDSIDAAQKRVSRAYRKACATIEYIEAEIKCFTPSKHKSIKDIVRDVIEEFNDD